MKLKNSFLSTFTSNKLFHNLAVKKQATNKEEALAGSIVDKRTPIWKPITMLIPTFVILGLFTIMPLFFNLYYAFFKETYFSDGSKKVEFTFEAFVDLFTKEPTFAVGIRNSLMYALIILPLEIGISLVISSAISTLVRKRAKGFWQTVFFLPYITNIVAISLTFTQIFSTNGMFNSIIGRKVTWLESGDMYGFKPLLVMITQGIWSSLAFNILLLTTAMLSVDKNLYRSASIDGIGGTKQFFNITLPSIRGTTRFLITMSIISGIKVFPLALFNNDVAEATGNGASTLMLFVYGRTGIGDFRMAASSAISLFIIGVSFSIIVRGGFQAIIRATNNLGEYHVWKKIKNSRVINKAQIK
ncbi:sn-glycerol-3-phosphate transport system permease protein ugpA [Mycoplasmopsis californica]|uniref:Sugar ABC transporter permease n=1 Tax=Mycoplasmopsis equigenitalium TaxID=114883 RepID=A0ABY5J589_9BACT|nr:sugar ABC transporter permease [Mycoplasmopsis equigenitalium]UUD36863.1 sugar ABC transporter permease [Mycoplasmopsis equigenitalium]VEU69842.1 sn-glycerol-3-phosphate transport system permease protein ugpA [Mycoplasmopsis californica]